MISFPVDLVQLNFKSSLPHYNHVECGFAVIVNFRHQPDFVLPVQLSIQTTESLQNKVVRKNTPQQNKKK